MALIFKTKDLVTKVLQNHDLSRDNDRVLTANVWYLCFKKLGVKLEILSAQEFLKIYISNQLPNHDHITRTRRKLQEDNPELRGELWNERHHLANEVAKEIVQTSLKL